MDMHRIPNKLVIGLAIAFYGYAFVTRMTAEAILDHTVAGATVLLVGLGLFKLRIVDPGVTKLLAVVFLWLGFYGGVVFMGISMSLAAVYAVVLPETTGRTRVPYLPFAVVTALLGVALTLAG